MTDDLTTMNEHFSLPEDSEGLESGTGELALMREHIFELLAQLDRPPHTLRV